MIKEHSELKKTNLLSRRLSVSQIEFSKYMSEIKTFCECNLLIVTDVITVTHGMKQNSEVQMMDIEILLEIPNMEQNTVIPDFFSIKKEISIINALNLHYEGNQQESISALKEINNYLSVNKLQAITPAYTVSHNPFIRIDNNLDVDIYVGINPNVM